jgi:hypothetical protein
MGFAGVDDFGFDVSKGPFHGWLLVVLPSYYGAFAENAPTNDS